MIFDKKLISVTIVLLLVMGLAASGCTGGSDQPNGSDEQSDGLKVSEFSYATNIDNQGNYDEHSDQYGPNEEIHIYFEMTGMSKENGKADVIQDLKVLDPNGDVVLDQNIVNDQFDLGDRTTIWFHNEVLPPKEGFDSGEYTVKIMINDQVSGEDIEYTEKFIVEDNNDSSSSEQGDSLSFKNFNFADNITEDWQYDTHDKYYEPTEEVGMYLELHGLKIENDEVSFKEYIKATTESGEVLRDELVFNTSVSNMEKGDYVRLTNYLQPPEGGFEKGEHTITIRVIDKHSDGSAKLTKEFIVE